MPELPEVETVVCGLRAGVVGKVISDVEFLRGDVFHLGEGRDIKDLVDAQIESVGRRGKYILLHLINRLVIIVHLGMTGQLTLVEEGEKVIKHTHVIIELEGIQLRFRDVRRFGFMELVEEEEIEDKFSHLGPEPLDISLDEFKDLFKGKMGVIKSLLLNQAFIAGLGNIYVDESLFAAGIHPLRRANSLSFLELNQLHQAIQSILAEAIRCQGSSVSDYVTVGGAWGSYQSKHGVYRKQGEACKKCGSIIERMVVGGRGTHFCPRCQPTKKVC